MPVFRRFPWSTSCTALAASRALDLPNVLTIIGGDIYDPSKASSPHRHGALRAMNRRLMNDADRVVAISTDTRSRAQEFYSVTRPIEVIPYGFRPPVSDRQSAGRTDDEGFHLVAVGRLVKRKGFSFLIEAVSRLPEHVKLRLVGDGPLDAELRALAREKGVENRVEFLGFSRDIPQFLAAVDVFTAIVFHFGRFLPDAADPSDDLATDVQIPRNKGTGP